MHRHTTNITKNQAETSCVNSLANFVALAVRGNWAFQGQAVSARQFEPILTEIKARFTHHTILVVLYRFQGCLGQFDVQYGDSASALLATI